MKKSNQINRVKVLTNEIPAELTSTGINGATRSIALYYNDSKFMCQGFFTQPLVGRMNSLEGLEKGADVYFRSIHMIGSNLFHVQLVGDETKVNEMCNDSKFYTLLGGISTTLNADSRMKTYLEVSHNKERWDVLVSLDKKACYVANRVKLSGKEIRIHKLIVVGDRLLGLTEKREVVIGQLTPDVIEKQNIVLEVELMDEVNTIGKVDLLEPVPNSEDLFLASIKNTIYQFDIWGEMAHFEELGDEVKQINSISFNHTSSILATSNGLYEIDVQELPNMVRATGLPRRITDSNLSGEFRVALYTEDPYVLGIHPAIGVFSKTKKDEVFFF